MEMFDLEGAVLQVVPIEHFAREEYENEGDGDEMEIEKKRFSMGIYPRRDNLSVNLHKMLENEIRVMVEEKTQVLAMWRAMLEVKKRSSIRVTREQVIILAPSTMECYIYGTTCSNRRSKRMQVQEIHRPSLQIFETRRVTSPQMIKQLVIQGSMNPLYDKR
jgi:hypothetical protein